METPDDPKKLFAAALGCMNLQVSAQALQKALAGLGDKGLAIASDLDLAGLQHKLAGYGENLTRRGVAAQQGGWPPPKSVPEESA